MIDVGRRSFVFGLGAALAAPAVIRVAPLMPISPRFTPLYVPVNRLGWTMELAEAFAEGVHLAWLKDHGWPPAETRSRSATTIWPIRALVAKRLELEDEIFQPDFFG
jgi:hypothetical protein